MTQRPTPLLCLDLDGTVRHGLNELGRFVNGPDDVVIFPEAVTMMHRWKAGGAVELAAATKYGVDLGPRRRREVRQWPDGSTLVGPWVAVDQPKED